MAKAVKSPRIQIEILKYLRSCIKSAWKGHELFAVWLVKKLKPLVIVDLGIDYGFSTFVFVIPGIGKVYGIDHFKETRYMVESRLDAN